MATRSMGTLSAFYEDGKLGISIYIESNLGNLTVLSVKRRDPTPDRSVHWIDAYSVTETYMLAIGVCLTHLSEGEFTW